MGIEDFKIKSLDNCLYLLHTLNIGLDLLALSFVIKRLALYDD